MTQEKVGRLFDVCFSTHRARVGVGMGLAQACNIVQRHGGTMAATSRPGEGTEIVIKLPTELRNEAPRPETVSA